MPGFAHGDGSCLMKSKRHEKDEEFKRGALAGSRMVITPRIESGRVAVGRDFTRYRMDGAPHLEERSDKAAVLLLPSPRSITT